MPRRRVFFYLDAHWALPLREEVQIISDTWSDIVILIDDFQVPDDPGYGFDDYGEGLRLTAEYLPEATWSRYAALYPVASSRVETGKKRGCIVLVSKGLEALVPRLTRLRVSPYAERHARRRQRWGSLTGADALTEAGRSGCAEGSPISGIQHESGTTTVNRTCRLGRSAGRILGQERGTDVAEGRL